MKNLFFAVACFAASALAVSCDTNELIESSDVVTQTTTVTTTKEGSNDGFAKSNPAPSPNCIYAKDIVAHYCTPQAAQFITPNPVNRTQITLAIKDAGYIPTGFCPNGGQHTNWDAFNIETEILGTFGGVIPGSQRSLSNVSTSNLSSLKTLPFPSFKVVRFYNLPPSAVANPPSSAQAFTLRVKITGRNSNVTSNHTTIYNLLMTSDPSASCQYTTPIEDFIM